ncbi:MAG: competence/damage-inducible protein A [Comamonas sp.]|nr:competence/damage-inducible protein A [Comamonas sp.]
MTTAAPPTSPSTSPSTNARFGALIIGDEILSGKREDKHLPKLIELLGARGCTLSWAEYVGDERERLTDALRRAFASADIVFSFGGIGATPDDHTRQCAGAALGLPLHLHPEAAALITQRMQDIANERGEVFEPQRPDNVHRLQMGMIPQSAHILPNAYNRIPGFSCRGAGGGWVHFTPGFPVMAWPMVEWALDHHHRDMQRPQSYAERSIILFTAQESALTPLMEAIEAAHPLIKVFSLPSVDHPEYGLHIELGVKGLASAVEAAWPDLLSGVQAYGAKLGPMLQRNI